MLRSELTVQKKKNEEMDTGNKLDLGLGACRADLPAVKLINEEN